MADKPSATIVAAVITGLFSLGATLLTICYGGGRTEFSAERDVAAIKETHQAPTSDLANVEIYTSRLRFLDRLMNEVHLVDFDDVRTRGGEPVSIPADRYEERTGAVISDDGGQYVDENFGYPEQYQPASAPNLYAPGPISEGSGGGGRETIVRFSADGGTAAVAGFGLYFIDADWPNWNSGVNGDEKPRLFGGLAALLEPSLSSTPARLGSRKLRWDREPEELHRSSLADAAKMNRNAFWLRLWG